MKKKLAVFAGGGLGYGCIEVLARGHTHWTMLLLGGACLSALAYIATLLQKKPLWLQALCGAVVITAAELATGLVVNVWLGWHVWDYSTRAFNFMGQICPLFSLGWFALCYALLWARRRLLSRTAHRREQ